MQDKVNILWIDDDVDKFSIYVDVLKNQGYKVFIARNYEETEIIVENNIINLFLIDIAMPHPNGIEILRRLTSMKLNANYAILSSFLYLQKYNQELSSLNIPVQLIDKHLPNVNSELLNEKFIKPINSVIEQGMTYTIKEYEEIDKKIEGINPFTVEYYHFLELPLVEKDKLSDLAEKMASKTIENAFKRGYLWVLLCGRSNEIVASVEREEDIPTEEEVLKIARRKNRAPYQFSKGLLVEDFHTKCMNETLKQYPTLTLEIQGHEYEIHFDTGCPSTRFSYEELISISAIRNATSFMKEWRNGHDHYRCIKLPELEVLLKSQKDGQTKKIILNGKAVRDWEQKSYAIKCNSNCIQKKKPFTKEQYCIYRKALLGRSLYLDNKLTLLIDGKDGKTHFK